MKHLLYLFAGITFSLSGQITTGQTTAVQIAPGKTMPAQTTTGPSNWNFEADSLGGWQQVPEDRWEVSGAAPLSGLASLHHSYDNPGSGVDVIGRSLEYPDLSEPLSIEFRIRHGYAPSSNNNWQLFFLSTGMEGFTDPSSLVSGMIFGVNFTGHDDHLKLWQLVEGNEIVILDTGLDYQEHIGTHGTPVFRMNRDPDGRWKISWYSGEATDSLVVLGEGREVEQVKGKYAGFRYAYTSAQDRKLWLDDIRVDGIFFRDTSPPAILSVKTIGLNGLGIRYDEEVTEPVWQSYLWKEMLPDSVSVASSMHRVFFRKEFPNRETQELHVSGITDREGNVMPDTVIFFRQDLASFGDVVINELLTDPDPPVYLPGCEYVELLNRYDQPIRLAGWTLSINSRSYDLQPVDLPPHEYLVLTYTGCDGRFGDVLQQGIITSPAALVNSGAELSLRDAHGRLIHRLDYEEMLRYDVNKSDGGWSLERVDPDHICGGGENWRVSDAWQGGTPGKENSASGRLIDATPPELIAVGIPDTHLVRLTFNEYLYIATDADTSLFRINDLPASLTVEQFPYAGRVIELRSAGPLAADKWYVIELNAISDCAGNILEGATESTLSIKLPEKPGQGGPVINEVMYDPVTGGSEYIELYNPGEDFYDLYDLNLNIRDPGSLSGNQLALSPGSRLFFPGQYLVLCRYPHLLKSEWGIVSESSLVGMEDWRSLPDDGTCIYLEDRSGKTLDAICYHDSLHQGLLTLTSGISLERIYPGCKDENTSCWTSAASSVNYGTPGTKNSQARPDLLQAGPDQSSVLTDQYREYGLVLEPKVFSPDADGHDDLLSIQLNVMEEVLLVDLIIANRYGIPVRYLLSGGIPGPLDMFTWDGEDDQGHLVPPGIYVVHVILIKERGRKILREACAVIYR